MLSMTMLFTLTLAVQQAPYTFDDVLRDLAPGGRGREAVTEMARLLEKTDVRYQSDAQTEAFMGYLRASLEKFDFMNIWNGPYLRDQGEGFRGVRLQGCNTGERYSIRLITAGESPCPVARIWDYDTRYALKKNDRAITGGRSFVVDVRSITATGPYSHRTALRFVEGLLKLIDPANIARLDAPECGLHPAVTGEARRVVNQFHQGFPRLSVLFDRYAVVRSFLTVKSREGVPYTQLNFRYGYKREPVKNDFPALAKSLKAMEGLYLIVMTVRNDRRRAVMRVTFDSREDSLALSLCTRMGRLVPVDDTGAPVFAEEIAIAGLTDSSYDAEFYMEHNVHGLKFITDSMIVRFDYRDRPAEGSWRMRLASVSPTRITGRYYNIIPSWLIDALIPLNMDRLILSVSQVMLAANGGEGSGASFRWDTREPAKVRLHFRAVSEFMDNYFMRYGLRVWSKSSVTDRRLTQEFRRLSAMLLEALRSDYGIAPGR